MKNLLNRAPQGALSGALIFGIPTPFYCPVLLLFPDLRFLFQLAEGDPVYMPSLTFPSLHRIFYVSSCVCRCSCVRVLYTKGYMCYMHHICCYIIFMCFYVFVYKCLYVCICVICFMQVLYVFICFYNPPFAPAALV